jgi:hypothetical protein
MRVCSAWRAIIAASATALAAPVAESGVACGQSLMPSFFASALRYGTRRTHILRIDRRVLAVPYRILGEAMRLSGAG